MLYLCHMEKPWQRTSLSSMKLRIRSTRKTDGALCLQWGRYQYDDKTEPQAGYRFIWRRPDGSLQPARGQARIPSLSDAELLIKLAREAGWGDRHADD